MAHFKYVRVGGEEGGRKGRRGGCESVSLWPSFLIRLASGHECTLACLHHPLFTLTHSLVISPPSLPSFLPVSLNTYQYTKLTTYVRTIYTSPLLEYLVVKNFIKALPPGEVASANEVEDWSR